MIIGVTGHRNLEHSEALIKTKLTNLLTDLNCKKLITGMAIGFDIVCAETAIDLDIPFVAAVPFVEQAKAWSSEQQKRYMNILEKASEIYIHPSPEKEMNTKQRMLYGFFGRNSWIADNSEILVAYLIKEDGGTKHCWDCAGKKNKKRINLADCLTDSPGSCKEEEK